MAAHCEQLLESELFGHAWRIYWRISKIREFIPRRRKAVRYFSISWQCHYVKVKLLRVLQEYQVRPLGGNRDNDIDVRIISATHRDAKAMTRKEFNETSITASTLSA